MVMVLYLLQGGQLDSGVPSKEAGWRASGLVVHPTGEGLNPGGVGGSWVSEVSGELWFEDGCDSAGDDFGLGSTWGSQVRLSGNLSLDVWRWVQGWRVGQDFHG